MLQEDAYLKFLTEHRLTQNQYLLLHLVYKKRPDLISLYKETFPSGDNTMIGEYFTKDLFDKGFLETAKNGNIQITRKFLDIFINKHTASEEIFDIYPTHFVKDSVAIPLSAMDRNVFANLYDIAIGSSIAEHLEVIEDIKYGIQKEMLNIGIDKFLKSKYWMVLRPKRLENQIKERIQTSRDHEF